MSNATKTLTFVLMLVAIGCGGGTRSVGSGKTPTKPKLAPVNTAALREFDSAMRALDLGGVEANDRAKARFEGAIKEDRTVWEAHHNLGVLALRRGDDDAAIEAFANALAVNPAHTPALLGRAEGYHRSGQTKKARADYQAVIDRAGDDEELRRKAGARLAALLRDNKQYEDAVDVLRETLRIAGPNAQVYVQLGLVYLAQGREDLVPLALTKAAELNEKEPSIYNAAALLSLAKGNSQEAFDQFDHATALDPKYVDARFNKASVLLGAGDYARAKEELKMIVQSNPEDLQAWVSLGVAHRGAREYDQAKAAWERVVKEGARRSSVRADAQFNLAVLAVDFLENTSAAKEALDRYLQDAPSKHPKRSVAEERKKELGL